MTHKKKNYKWCTSGNNGNGARLFYWKHGHDKCKKKQGNKASICFANPTNNVIMYFSYPMTTSEEYTEEEEEGRDDIQDTDFISLSHFELL